MGVAWASLIGAAPIGHGAVMGSAFLPSTGNIVERPSEGGYERQRQEMHSRREAAAILPRLDEIPIPRDVQPGPGWTEQMIEVADHIGSYATLCLVAVHGGRQVHVPRNPERSPFLDCLDEESVATMSWVYAGTRFAVPVGRVAVDRARRSAVIAAVRSGSLTASDAQKIIGTSRTYVAHLVNHTDEGVGMEPLKLPLPAPAATPRELAILQLAATLARLHLTAAGSVNAADAVAKNILSMRDRPIADLRAWLAEITAPKTNNTTEEEHG